MRADASADENNTLRNMWSSKYSTVLSFHYIFRATWGLIVGTPAYTIDDNLSDEVGGLATD